MVGYILVAWKYSLAYRNTRANQIPAIYIATYFRYPCPHRDRKMNVRQINSLSPFE